jgi:putative ATP-dependent endonuclease of the OLD family
MRLSRFEIRNFKGLQNAGFDWNDIVVLIGENNAGKSTVLQALQWFLSGGQVKDELLFCDKLTTRENAIELIGRFSELTDIERQAVAVRGRMDGDQWVLKKTFWCEVEEAGEVSWKEMYYSYSGTEVIANWPENDAAWGNFPDDY